LCRQVRLELGRLALARGDLLQAETELSAAARACRRAADHELLEEGLADLAEVRLARGEFNEACVTLDELATLSHVRGDPAIYATALIELAVAFRRAGQPRFAGACDERAVEVARATRRDDLIADARLGEAETARLLDELERAEPLFAEAYEAAEAAGSPGSAVLASLGRADLAMSRGEPAAARARLAEAEGALADAREVETNQRRPGAAIESLGGRPRVSFQALEAMVRALRSRLMAATGGLGEARRLARSLPPARAASMICAPRDVARDRTLALLLAGEPEAAREAALELSEPWRSAFGGRARLASLRSASARSRGWGGSRNLGPEIAKQARAMLERALHDAGRRGLLGLARRVGLGLAEAAALGGDLRLASTLLGEVSRGSPIDRRFHAQVGLARLSVQRTAGELAAACRTLTEVDRLLPGLHDPALEVQLALEGARVLRLHGEVAAARARILLGEERLAQLQATFGEGQASGESVAAHGGEVGAWMRRAEERLAAERRALEDGSGFVGGVSAASNEGGDSPATGPSPADLPVSVTEVRPGPDRRLAERLSRAIRSGEHRGAEERCRDLVELACELAGAGYGALVEVRAGAPHVVALAGTPPEGFLERAFEAPGGEAPLRGEMARPLTGEGVSLGALVLGPAVRGSLALDAVGALCADVLRLRRYTRRDREAQEELQQLRHARVRSEERFRKAARSRDEAERALTERESFGAIVGRGPAISQVIDLARRVSASKVSVLLQGESGTGKELLARAIHAASHRATGPFVSINCGAMPETLLEAELFGYSRGAFTGATRDRRGLFEAAHRGTLLLDEVTDMSPGMQAKLLRVLEEGEIRPLGATQVRHVDVRLVSACNKNLADEVEAGRFRQDLFYRLNVVTLEPPPLRDRLEDLPLLCERFLADLSARLGSPRRLGPAAMEALLRYHWPGNVRELRNELERAAVLAGDDITLEDLSARVRAGSGGKDVVDVGGASEDDLPLKQRVERFERKILVATLERLNHNRTHSARALGMSRFGFLKKLDKYGLRE
jgi:DNA-binding NtrC family response regulator